MGGGPNDVTTAPGISRRQRSRIAAEMTLAVLPASRRLENSSSITYIEPRFGAFAPAISDCPEMPTVSATPGVS